jgi:hypothetical protein
MDRDVIGRFDQAMESIYYRARDAVGHRATRFLQMVRRRGGLDAAHSLMASARTSPGFRALAHGGRKDLTVEALVLRPEFSGLFNKRELATARNRLDHPDES